jgi:hypothetical protein
MERDVIGAYAAIVLVSKSSHVSGGQIRHHGDHGTAFRLLRRENR